MNKKFNTNLSLFLFGQGLSSLGTLIQKYSVSLFVLSLTQSSKIFAIVMILSSIPNIILGPFGGVLGDRLDKRKLMIYLDCLSGGILVVTFVVSKYAGVNLWFLCVIITSLSAISSLYIPSANSAIPFLVAKDDLIKANSLNTFIITLTNVIAPIISGFLFALVGIEVIIIINAVTFLFSAIIEVIMKIDSNNSSEEKLSTKVVIDDFLQGIHSIKTNSSIKIIILCSFLCSIIVMPIYTIAIPYVSKVTFAFSDIQYGLIESIIMIGLLIGALLINILNRNVSLKNILSFSIIIVSLFIIVLGALVYIEQITLKFNINMLFTSFSIICLCVGAIISTISISLISLLQLVVDKEKIARINSIIISLSTIAVPIGQAVIGLLLESVKSEIVLIGSALIMLILGINYRKKICDTVDSENEPIEIS